MIPPTVAVADRPAVVRVALFGDSLGAEAAPYFDWLLHATGRATVADHAFGGTAACDWLPQMRRTASTSAPPRAVVLEFSGNVSTPCMHGVRPESAAAVTRYRKDVGSAVALFSRVHAHVYLVGAPVSRAQWQGHDPRADALGRAFAAIAAHHPATVTYVDAGRAVEGPGGSYTATMRCLFFEPCTGPVVRGIRTNVVRSPDGVHLCPVQTARAAGRVGRCPVYSSGAFRFAAAMEAPLLRRFHLST